MAWKVLGPVDPATGQVKSVVTQQPVQQQQKQLTEADVGGNLEALAAITAHKQMQWSMTQGGQPTMQDFEAARKQAFQDLMQFQRNIATEKIRSAEELKRQETMKVFEENVPKRPSDTMLEKQAGLSTAIDTIMNLNALHADARKVPGYSAAGLSAITTPLAQITDPRVRLYEAEKGGAIINLGRGVLEDTGQVAGKEEAQNLMKALMPGQGDDERMASQKTIGLLQKVMIGLDGRIRDYKKSNYQTDALEADYKKAYANYLPLVTQFGSDAQQSHPVASPDELFGGGEAQKGYEKTFAAKALTPPTQVGLSTTTNAQLNLANAAAAKSAAILGQPSVNVPPSGPTFTGTQESAVAVPQGITPSGPTYPEAPMPTQNVAQPFVQQAGSNIQAASQAVGGAINWLQGLLPENRYPQGNIPDPNDPRLKFLGIGQ